MTVFGWDASDFDWPRGPMDFGAARAAGVDFFTHKATEGTRTTHVRYGEGLRRARDAGIPALGAYAVPRTPGNGGHGSVAEQVDFFLSYVDAQTPWWRDWPHWFFQVDLEHWSSGGQTYDAVPAWIGPTWCGLLHQRAGRRVVLYAPKWAYGNTLAAGWPLWGSDYGGNPRQDFRGAYPGDASVRWAPYSGQPPAILQYGSQTIIGRQAPCDANAWRGTTEEFLRWIQAGGAPAGESGGDMDADQSRRLSNIDEILWQGVVNGSPQVSGLVIPSMNGGKPVTLPVKLVERVAAIEAKIDASALGGIDSAALSAAFRAALNDPSVRALLVDAVREGANLAEDS